MTNDFSTICGLIIREVNIGEADKLLTLLTTENGKLTVRAYGARRHKSPLVSLACTLNYCRFILKPERRSHHLRVVECDLINGFFAVRRSLERLALAQYLMEAANEMTGDDLPDSEDFLRLTLNTLFALDHALYTPGHIKAAYEMRLAASAGYAPLLSRCGSCGEDLRPRDGQKPPRAFLDVMEGCLKCEKCAVDKKMLEEEERLGVRAILVPVSPAVQEALRYIVSAPLKRLFAFSLDGEAEEELSGLCETYLINHLGHRIPALEFYKKYGKTE